MVYEYDQKIRIIVITKREARKSIVSVVQETEDDSDEFLFKGSEWLIRLRQIYIQLILA